jgi:Rhs element Vgr protein
MRHREFTITVDGKVVPRSYQLLSVSVVSEANKIAYSRIAYKDGNAAKGNFSIVDEGLFDYGKKVSMSCDDESDSGPLFVGIVVAQQVKLRESSASQLIITCKHASVLMSIATQARYYENITDQDLFEQLFNEYALNAHVQPTATIQHKQLVQYDTTDWDFCLARAQAAGLVIYTQGEKIQIVPPKLDREPAVNLAYGATLLSADLKIDARSQTHDIQAVRWNSADQTMAQSTGEITLQQSPGVTSTSTLAKAMGDAEHTLHTAAQSDEELQALVNAVATINAVNRVSGTLTTIGVGSVFAGDTVMLSGLSKSFNGEALVTGVRHEFSISSGWRTFYQLGGLALPPKPPCGPTNGLHVGIVVDIVDPDNEWRVKIKLPMLDNSAEGIWARVASIDAGANRGFYVRPELGDEVIVGFIQNDMHHPAVLGMLHSSALSATETPDANNHIKTWVTRSGLALRFNDDLHAITLSSPNGNVIEISEDASGITLKDENGNQYIMNAAGISLQSASDLSISASGKIEINAGTSLDLAAGAQFSAQGDSGATLESSATTVVKGSLVKIN